jgi:hypothetical protein
MFDMLFAVLGSSVINSQQDRTNCYQKGPTILRHT